jgi:hypothetical protein
MLKEHLTSFSIGDVMTAIVGLEFNGSVIIGADSAGVDVDTYDICARSDEKVFIVEETMVLGFIHSFRMGQLLRYAFSPPEKSSKKDDMSYLVVDVIDAIRSMFKDKGYMKKDDDVEAGGTFLLGYNGRLYTVADDFQVGRSMNGYDACGCGAHYALGSLHSTKHNPDPIDRVKLALGAAVHHNAGVRPPFVVVSFPAL